MKKTLFNEYLLHLVNEGFSFPPEWGKWQREQKDRIEQINISYDEYSDEYYIRGMSASIIYKDVEEILDNELKKSGIEPSYVKKTIKNSLSNIDGVDYSKFETNISDEESYIVEKEIEKVIEYGAYPFLRNTIHWKR